MSNSPASRPFPCTSCGACCRHIDRFPDFPYPHTHGVCAKLGPDGLCTIYDTRPLLCRVDALGDALRVPRSLWHALSAHACDTLQAEDGLPDTFRVILDSPAPPMAQ